MIKQILLNVLIVGAMVLPIEAQELTPLEMAQTEAQAACASALNAYVMLIKNKNNLSEAEEGTLYDWCYGMLRNPLIEEIEKDWKPEVDILMEYVYNHPTYKSQEKD